MTNNGGAKLVSSRHIYGLKQNAPYNSKFVIASSLFVSRWIACNDNKNYFIVSLAEVSLRNCSSVLRPKRRFSSQSQTKYICTPARLLIKKLMKFDDMFLKGCDLKNEPADF